jgi:3-hydroxyacyl-CoA dehydrogenase
MARGLTGHGATEGRSTIGTRYEARGDVAVVTLDNPPVNGLGYDVRAAVAAGLDRAAADDAIRAVVITGAGKAFSGGADIREFNTPKALAEPALRTLIALVEASLKPVVAAVNGVCMGGGLELALGCHGRVASAKATVALPEVKLGLLPGAGGTQRLPRVVGIETALTMIVGGAAVPARDLASTALFDQVVDADPVDAAIALGRRLADGPRPLPRVRDRRIDAPNAEAFLGFARTSVAAASRHLPAPLKCVEAVAASVDKPFDEGLKLERALFQELVQTTESRALRHAFFAERAASRIPGLPDDTPVRDVQRVAVIGAGTMGVGIAVAFLDAGLPVTLVETSPDALERGMAAIRRIYEGAARKGKLTESTIAGRLARLAPTVSLADVAAADLVVEAVFEDMAVKQEVFRRLDGVARPGAILATNTSALDVDRIAATIRRPADVVGAHFFSPANVMKLLEVVRGAATAPDVLATMMQVGKRIGKTAVVAGVCDGFIGNRLIEQYIRQAMFLVEDGASPQEVDAALETFGMAMGPFRMSDLAGNDIGWKIRQRRYVDKPHVTYSRIADRLCERGRFGQKTGAGWYRYEPGARAALPDPEVDAIVAAYRDEIGVAPRAVAADEIVERCVLALVNEGARVLDDGIALRASDIDVVYLTGYGFPRHRGGPMFHADTLGLWNVVRAMRRIAALPRADAVFWEPAPRLARLAAEGGTFNG